MKSEPVLSSDHRRLAAVRGTLLLLLCLLCYGACFWPSLSAGEPAPPTLDETQEAPPDVRAGESSSTNASESIYLSFGLRKFGFLNRTIFGIPLWQYISSLIYIFLASYISKLLDHLIGAQLKKKAGRTRTRLDDTLLELIRGPIKVVSFVILMHVGLTVFDWPVWLRIWLSKGLKVVVAVSLTYLGLKVIDLAMHHWRQRSALKHDKTFNDQLFPIINTSAKVFLVVVALVVTCQNLDFDVTGLIASLSIGGLALGLAAQDTLSNLFGAVAVFTDKPFRVGERIQLDGLDGTVESIGLRSTRVRNLEGHLITVPNKTMGNATITNITRRPTIRTLINIGITYDTSVPKVKEALQILDEVYRQHPMSADAWISFNKFNDSSLNLFVIHWWKNTEYKAYLAGLQEMNLSLKERFDTAGIDFAFPTSTLHLKQDSDWNLRSPTDSQPA